MKTRKTNQRITNFFSGILMLAMLFILASCSTTTSFLNSSVVPGATGKVTVKQDNNENYRVKVQIDDLASIERLQLSKDTYVVWLETDRGNAENLGQLVSSTGFMSKQHTATLETVTSFKPIRVFVTAENGINVRYPSSDEILTTEKFYE